jgi:hypothetical protein
MARASRKVYPKPDVVVATLSTPAVMNRDPEYRAFDGVVPESGKRSGSYIPPCTFGKADKIAESVKVKLFFAGADGASEMSSKTGKDYAPGAYLRVCGPKTNDELLFMSAPSVEAGMKRAAAVEKCIDADGSTPATCVLDANKLAGLRRKKAAAPKKRRGKK